jgi:hypothetical protein
MVDILNDSVLDNVDASRGIAKQAVEQLLSLVVEDV